jgi:hypothetical protein
MDSRDRPREPGQRAGTKTGGGGRSPREAPGSLRPVGLVSARGLAAGRKQDVVQNRELEPSEDFARRGDIETERPDHEGPFDRGRSDEKSGRPVQLVRQLGGFTTQTSKKS